MLRRLRTVLSLCDSAEGSRDARGAFVLHDVGEAHDADDMRAAVGYEDARYSVLLHESLGVSERMAWAAPDDVRCHHVAHGLGIVDVHEEMGKHQQALDEMKQMAARIGADAVVGVEFHHGEGHGAEPTHLSGIAVRYISTPL